MWMLLSTDGFQSTLPRGERHGQRRWAAACKNFNPRSREGSDSDGELVDLLKEISIHAPARGATHVATNLTNGAKISIHAPARGATIYTGGLAKVTLFQSTLPRGERPKVAYNPWLCFGISIHAPARGATGLATFIAAKKLISIHAPARGATKGKRR